MTYASTNEIQRLALLGAAPCKGNKTRHNDSLAIYNSLDERGFLPEQIISIEGLFTRKLLIASLTVVNSLQAKSMEEWCHVYWTFWGWFSGKKGR